MGFHLPQLNDKIHHRQAIRILMDLNANWEAFLEFKNFNYNSNLKTDIVISTKNIWEIYYLIIIIYVKESEGNFTSIFIKNNLNSINCQYLIYRSKVLTLVTAFDT